MKLVATEIPERKVNPLTFGRFSPSSVELVYKYVKICKNMEKTCIDCREKEEVSGNSSV